MSVFVGFEINNVGTSRSREDGAALTAALVETLGADAARRLASDGALPHAVADQAAAERLIANLSEIEHVHGHIVHVSAWLS